MKTLGQGLATLAVLGALLAGALVASGAVRAAVAVDGLALFLGALLMLWLVAATHAGSGAGGPSAYERARGRRGSPAVRRPATLERLEREVVMAGGNAFDFHLRLRPRFQSIAAHRLAARRGLELEGGRHVLGEEAWELLRPDRPPPADRFAPGVAIERQRDLLDRLERID